MNADLELLKEVVRQAGALALDLRGRKLTITHKPGGSPVTNADLAVDDLLRERLTAARPDYGWLSEETTDGPERLDKARVFMLDPIDGTSAYMKGRDWWSICAAVIEDGAPVAGVVFAPSLDEFYEAELGGGAFLNGRPIRVTNRTALEDCRIVGDPKLFAHPAWPAPWPAMRIENRNSVAYRMCLVASSEFDACLAPSPKHEWDIAAADLIVTEAGGLATDHLARRFAYNQAIPLLPSLVCAGPALHPLLIERVSHMEDRR